MIHLKEYATIKICLISLPMCFGYFCSIVYAMVWDVVVAVSSILKRGRRKYHQLFITNPTFTNK